MKYDPEIHHRRSVRLHEYDYSSEGLYFVTICVQNKKCLFGRIEEGEMKMNEVGRMVEEWYQKIPTKFDDIHCMEFIIMPNHFHCILHNVGADPCVRPNASNEPTGSSLSRVIQWFKTMTTNEYIRNVKNNHWTPFDKRLWQRNYYEHIIRNQRSYEEIANYIVTNPLRWKEDQLYFNTP